MTTDEFALVGSTRTETIHLVYAGGSRQDGSLYGYSTLCGMHIFSDTGLPGNAWQELESVEPTCGNCKRIAHWEAHRRRI